MLTLKTVCHSNPAKLVFGAEKWGMDIPPRGGEKSLVMLEFVLDNHCQQLKPLWK